MLDPAEKRLAIICFLLSLFGGMNFGYNLTIITPALAMLGVDDATTISLLTSALIAGCMAGSLVSGPVSFRHGRRLSVLALSAVSAAACVLVSLWANVVWIGIWRTVLGFTIGSLTAIIPTLVAETTPSEVRGKLNTFFQ
ncbi:major facilitator, sugar transporter-like, partial [Kipferlia bialata]|eukprot:g14321.t1